MNLKNITNQIGNISRRLPFLYTPIKVGDIQLPKLNLLLFIGAIYTTYLTKGPWYSASIMTILLSHELGHFFMCRKYNVSATLPFFLPMPIGPFGTFGAVIKMRGQMPSKKALFDIGAAGPIAGLVFAIPCIVIGLYCSEVMPTNGAYGISLGEPILFTVITNAIFGNIAEGYDLFLHPVAFAGWAGLFVTALNLLPIGQLDGGHIIYALLGEKSKAVFRIGVFAFCLMTAIIWYFYHMPGWIVVAILLLLFGFRHPAPMDPVSAIGRRRQLIGIGMFIIFLLSFTPIPFRF